MGEVYRATDTHLKRHVAIKVLPEVATGPERLMRFRREAEVLASLSHPHIATVYGLEQSGGVTALVMELIEGPTLADRIAGGRVPVEEAQHILLQIADALEAAHERGIVHRDLKPANVKLRPDGTAKVLDFGLAKTTDSASLPLSPQATTVTTPPVTHPGVILGTAAYMSPEQARGIAVDKRADIWAFGAVAYEMLTGQPAFMRGNVADTLAAIVKEEPRWDAVPGDVPPGLRWVLQRCLEKDHKRRLRDIGDVRLALDGTFEPATPVTTAGTRSRTNWRWSSMLVAAGVLAGLAIALAVSAALPKEAVDSGPISRFEVPFRAGQTVGHVALSPDGLTLVYQALGPDGRPWLYRRLMDSFEPTRIENSQEGADPFFSSDGQWLGFFAGRALRRASATGGPAETVAELPGFPRGGAWDVDSIVVGGGSSGLWRVPLTGGQPTVIAPAGEGRELSSPQVLPGGRAILLTESRFSAGASSVEAPELQILHVASGRRRTLLDGSAGRVVPSGHVVFVRSGTLWGVAFDADRLDVRGSPVPLLPAGRNGVGRFAVADEGSLAYVPNASSIPRRLIWVDRAGREEAIAAPPRGYTYPRLSPDGKRVAIDVRDEAIDIWLWAFDTETLTRLTFEPTQDEYPVWTPDGLQVLFASFRNNAWGVFAQSADGRGAAHAVGTGPDEIDPLSVSPDGRTLVARTAGDLVGLPLGMSGQPAPLWATTVEEPNADISPDGRWIVYQSNESGRHEIYVRPFPAVASGLWQISNDGGRHPLWARNGNEIFFVAPSGLMSVPVRREASFAFGAARTVLKDAADRYWLTAVGRSYDASPDGQRFLMLKQDTAVVSIQVVRSWGTELNRLVPTR